MDFNSSLFLDNDLVNENTLNVYFVVWKILFDFSIASLSSVLTYFNGSCIKKNYIPNDSSVHFVNSLSLLSEFYFEVYIEVRGHPPSKNTC